MDGDAARSVVAGRRLGVLRERREAAGRDEIGQERRVVDDPERPTELTVLVGDRVEAMGARGDDGPLPHPIAVERVDRGRRQHLEDIVIAHPSGGIARARLLLPEDRERDPGGIDRTREFRHGAELAMAKVGGRTTRWCPLEQR